MGQKNDPEQTQRFNIEKELRDQLFGDVEFERTPGLPSGKKAAMSDSYGDVPGVRWARHFGGSGDDHAQKVVSDHNGNAYVTGYFNGTISTSAGEYSAAGYRDGFVAKFNSSGTLVWFKPMAAEADMKVYPYAISLDASGNILTTGYFTGELEFGASNHPEKDDYNTFIAKLSPDGELLFAREYGNSAAPEIGIAIESDHQDNIFILGKQSANITSRNPSFILKLDANGNLIWEQFHDEGFNDFSVTSNGIYFTGSIISSADGYLDENVSVAVPSAYEDIFVAKSDLNGLFKWGKTLEHEGDGYHYSHSPLLATDDNENIYLTGNFINNLRLGEFILKRFQSVFTAILNAAGEFQWASLLNGTCNISAARLHVFN